MPLQGMFDRTLLFYSQLQLIDFFGGVISIDFGGGMVWREFDFGVILVKLMNMEQ